MGSNSLGIKQIARISWEALLKFQRSVMIVCSLMIVIGISLGATLRYIFKTDLYGMEEIIVIFAFWLYFMGGSYGSYQKNHITADLVSVYVTSPKIRSIVMLISSLITTGLCYMATYYAVSFFSWSLIKGGTSSVWRIPIVIPQGAIFLSFSLMSFYFTIHLIDDIKKLKLLILNK
ncbi:TRAP transporter small permease [Desulfosporosinus sp. BICA1-9]|uniref:TRAP transporter small permease n=1 Tax=Desulfosporosinus sp. BICA1-9 TaxID=1531958 RepID=UPI00061E4213|nr:TRAP transporter small permease [Desulfosporosinus sp. BICA1-9]KJS49300.1 MAG: hypothetical protein VR66_09345 [Peptococcaceae bacterium BRH_c23]HBW37520.1 TRAP transporter small permease [Desulfosporosinus sp.]